MSEWNDWIEMRKAAERGAISMTNPSIASDLIERLIRDHNEAAERASLRHHEQMMALQELLREALSRSSGRVSDATE